MKKVISRKKLIWSLVALGCLMIAALFHWNSNRMIKALTDQQLAQRWSSSGGWAQISAFFSNGMGISEERIKDIEYTIESNLVANSMMNPSENTTARSIISAYSARGTLELESKEGSIKVECLGVGGDFFLFHPIELLYGTGFNQDVDVNDDFIILDEVTAWKLYGSSDIVGQTVLLDEVPLIIAGVAPNGESNMEKAAGLGDTLCYVSFNKLKEMNEELEINTYEILMPNPVKQYALGQVQTAFGLGEYDVEYVENTYRFDFLNRIEVIRSFGKRSMNGKAILYPYWENIARGTEDFVGLSTLLCLIFLVMGLGIIATLVGLWWKHNKDKYWNQIKRFLLDLPENIREYLKKKKQKEEIE